MNLTTVTTLAGLGLAAGIGWYLGGSVGTGVMAGFLAGASVAGGCVALQRRIAVRSPQFLVHAVMAGFLIKAFAMLTLTLAVRYVDALANVCDAVSFLIAFALTAIGILLPATLDTLRWIGMRKTASAFEESRAL